MTPETFAPYRNWLAHSMPRYKRRYHRNRRHLSNSTRGQRGLPRKVATTYVYVYTITMRITFDPAKREKTWRQRGLDFADAAVVFSGATLEVQDTRQDYGETRIICFGLLAGWMVVVGYTPRGADRHVFSMRKANDREKARIAPLLTV